MTNGYYIEQCNVKGFQSVREIYGCLISSGKMFPLSYVIEIWTVFVNKNCWFGIKLSIHWNNKFIYYLFSSRASHSDGTSHGPALTWLTMRAVIKSHTIKQGKASAKDCSDILTQVGDCREVVENGSLKGSISAETSTMIRDYLRKEYL